MAEGQRRGNRESRKPKQKKKGTHNGSRRVDQTHIAFIRNSEDEELRHKSMTVRTKKATVTFRRPLKPTSFNCQQPTETCRLVIEEEERFRLLVLAYQRAATMLHTLAILGPQRGFRQVLPIDFGGLEAALEVDTRA